MSVYGDTNGTGSGKTPQEELGELNSGVAELFSGSGSRDGEDAAGAASTPRTGSRYAAGEDAAGAASTPRTGSRYAAEGAAGAAATPRTGSRYAAGEDAAGAASTPRTGSRYAAGEDAAGAASTPRTGSRYAAGGAGNSDNGILRQRTAQRGEKSGPPKVRRKGLRILLVLLVILMVLVGGGAGFVYYLHESGRRSLLAHEDPEGITMTAPEDAIVAEGGRRVTYKGHTYERNDDVISILCLGVDRDEEMNKRADELKIGEQGQADTLFVAALNLETGEITMINISRDTMVDVDVYDVEGGLAEIKEMQICLAYGYGDGREKSCENESKSVSRLLYGIPMDAYGSIEMPAIGVLNDAVGGVTVTVLEDLSARDSAMTKGATITLTGDQAQYYVRARSHDTAEANNARMQRQRQYLTAFVRKALSAARSNISIVLSLYQAARTYMTTDIDLAKTVYLTSLIMTHDFTSQNIVTVPGEATLNGEYAEYRVDEEALYQIILDVYYNEVGENGEELEQTEAVYDERNLIPEDEEETEEPIVSINSAVLH